MPGAIMPCAMNSKAIMWSHISDAVPTTWGETGPLSQGPGLKRVGGRTEYAI
jgi:hypothetical protein